MRPPRVVLVDVVGALLPCVVMQWFVFTFWRILCVLFLFINFVINFLFRLQNVTLVGVLRCGVI